MTRSGEPQDIVMRMIEQAVAAREPPPKNAVIAARLGYRSEGSVSHLLKRMIDAGLITIVTTSRCSRYIEICATGQRTADSAELRRVPGKKRKKRRRRSGSDGLTANERRVLNALRRICTPGEGRYCPTIAKAAGIQQQVCHGILASLRNRGLVVSGLSTKAAWWLPKDMVRAPETRVEIRDGVKVTICPPRWAAGAYRMRTLPL